MVGHEICFINDIWYILRVNDTANKLSGFQVDNLKMCMMKVRKLNKKNS